MLFKCHCDRSFFKVFGSVLPTAFWWTLQGLFLELLFHLFLFQLSKNRIRWSVIWIEQEEAFVLKAILIWHSVERNPYRVFRRVHKSTHCSNVDVKWPDIQISSCQFLDVFQCQKTFNTRVFSIWWAIALNISLWGSNRSLEEPRIFSDGLFDNWINFSRIIFDFTFPL
jgi:hypothetical protein